MNARLKTLLILAIVLIAVVAYALAPFKIGEDPFTMRKISVRSIVKPQPKPKPLPLPEKSRPKAPAKAGVKAPAYDSTGVDTTHHTVLFFGDSMTSGLALAMEDYCGASGHKLHALTWNSSSTKLFANTNIIDTYIRKYNPSFVIICLGSNELFVKDLDEREAYIRKIVGKLGRRPVVWVSPPNWKPDTGLTNLLKSILGSSRVFDSSHISISRGTDHIHPDVKGAKKWMSMIAKWISNPKLTAHPIRMQRDGKHYVAESYEVYGPDFGGFKNGDRPELHSRLNKIR